MQMLCECKEGNISGGCRRLRYKAAQDKAGDKSKEQITQGLEGCGEELDFVLKVMRTSWWAGGEGLHGSILYAATLTTYGKWGIGGQDGNKKPVLQLEGDCGGGLD